MKASLEKLMGLVDGKAAGALKDFGLKRVSHLAFEDLLHVIYIQYLCVCVDI